MMADIANSTWQLIGTAVIVLGIVLIVLTVAESRLPRTKKFLAYEIQTYVPDLLIFSGRRTIPGSVVMMLKIINTGSIPITPLDFGGALCFHLEEGRKIYNVEVVESTPTAPFKRSAAFFTMARPMPVPGALVAFGRRLNGSNTRSICSGGIPKPLSCTRNIALPPFVSAEMTISGSRSGGT